MSSPLLVLVHGTRFDAASWRGYAQLLPGADVLAVDLPGHGTRFGEPWSWAAARQTVADAVASAGPGRPVVVAGHSLGGYVAASYAASRPAALSGLVLIGATADATRHPRLTLLYTGFARLLPVVGAERMALLANGTLRRLGLGADEIPDSSGYAVTPQAWADVVAHARADMLADLACPVFLVAGQLDQLRIDLSAYAAACRDPRVRLIPRASHLAPLTHRAQVAAVLAEAIEAAGAPSEGDEAPYEPDGRDRPERDRPERDRPERR